MKWSSFTTWWCGTKRLRPGRGNSWGQRPFAMKGRRGPWSPTIRRSSASVDHGEMFDELRFDLNLVVAGDDGEHVAIVYQSPMRLRTTRRWVSMEIFPGSRRAHRRSVEPDTNKEWSWTDRVLDELGYYLLAGAGGEGPVTLMDEAPRRNSGSAPGSSGAVERQGGVVADRGPPARHPAGCRSPPRQPNTTLGIR